MIRRPNAAGPRRVQRGMTLVELMVALLLGLVTTYFIAQVFAVAEGQKRTATFGTDAQVNGAVAMHTLRRHVMNAGYGVAAAPSALGCSIFGKYGSGGTTVNTPAGLTLAPVLITPGTSASAPSDTVSVVTSSKSTFAAPIRTKADHLAVHEPSFVVIDGSSHGVKVDDVILAVPKDWATAVPPEKCMLFSVKEDASTPATQLSRLNIPHVSGSASSWNAAAAGDWPAGGFAGGSVILNLGAMRKMDFGINGDTFQVVTWTEKGIGNAEQLNSGIVLLKALYGRDTDGNGTVDTYDTVSPTNNAEWQRVLAVRLVMVARSGQRERDEVTAVAPAWSVGTGVAVTYDAFPGSTTTCADTAASCELPLPLGHVADWKHYRYKVFDTAVQVRNLMWQAEE